MSVEGRVAAQDRNYMSDLVPVEQLEGRKSEILRANPPSIVELARNLHELGSLIKSGEVDPFVVFREAAMINQAPPVPRDENFALNTSTPPRWLPVSGELFPEITLQDEKGLTRVETLLYLPVGDDGIGTNNYLGLKNHVRTDTNGGLDPATPTFDTKWWERIMWRSYTGPFSVKEVEEVRLEESRRDWSGPLQRDRAFAEDSTGSYWELETFKDRFKRPSEEFMKWKEAGLGMTLERPTWRDYQETLAIAKQRPDAVRLAVQSLTKDLGLAPSLSPVMSPSGNRRAA